MTTGRYSISRNRWANGELSWSDDVFKLYLTLAYVPDLVVHGTISDLTGISFISDALTNKSVSDGYLTADDVTIASATGDPFDYIIMVDETADCLIAAWEQTANYKLPYSPTGVNMIFNFSQSIYGILRI
jgi:hypothetical protein